MIFYYMKKIMNENILNFHCEQGLELSEGKGELGDFIALYLSTGYVGFAFDLGSGTAVVR